MRSQDPGAVPGEAPLELRHSTELAWVPAERLPVPAQELPPGSSPRAAATATAPAAPAPLPGPAPMVANAQVLQVPGELSAGAPAGMPVTAATWAMGGVALLASVGWVVERRRRRQMETEKDSVMWADGHHPSSASIITTVGKLDDILPDSPDPAEAARAIYVTAIGETNSRREATLIDLHQLRGKLQRRRERGDNVAALLLLQQHLVDFRYTSPWVFLELLELYRVLERQVEWEVARDAFRQRFGQNAPAWTAPSTADMQLADDRQLASELERDWPFREARMFVLRWMLGEPDMRLKCSGPPLLGLGMYRDLMLLDAILDDVLVLRTQPADSLL